MDYISKIAKFLFPKSLIARFTLIICVPMIMCQFVAVYLFYERHWYNVSVQTSRMLSSQIDLVVGEYFIGDMTKVVKYSRLFGFSFEVINELPKQNNFFQKNELDILHSTLTKNLKSFLCLSQNNKQTKINVFLSIGEGRILKVTIPSKPLVNPTSEIFVFWIIGISIMFLMIAMLFAKNQIRSIQELSYAADNFGKGITDSMKFKPSGASEIRQAGIAFIKMQERIERQVQKRLQMLAMISHDLRTPLTRMLLQLELLPKNLENNSLKNDVDSMKHMIDSYLDFARGEEAEKAEIIELNKWLVEFFDHYNFKNTKLIQNAEKIYVEIKPLSFMRAITNIISNAEKYATYAEFSYTATEGNIVLILEDNGPGITDEEKHLIFKAFYRSDKARRIDRYGSVGLGLSIAKEIILSYKGAIVVLDGKKLGGAKIVVTIPRKK